MKVVAIIQARMGSTRLPGKVMLKTGGKTLLAHVIQRILKAAGVDCIVVATSVNPRDDIIQAETNKLDIFCYRGSEEDVLARYYEAAVYYEADVIIRITSDCPLLDPILLTNMIKQFFFYLNNGNKIDYLSNCLERTYPRGLDIEIFTLAALKKSYHEANLANQREHVTPYIYQNPKNFFLQSYINKHENLSNHRWTVDTVEDFQFFSKVYDRLKNDNFTTGEILELLNKEPWLVEINKNIKQKEYFS